LEGHVSCVKKKKRNANKILVGKPEGKRPCGRRRRKWEDNLERTLEK